MNTKSQGDFANPTARQNAILEIEQMSLGLLLLASDSVFEHFIQIFGKSAVMMEPLHDRILRTIIYAHRLGNPVTPSSIRAAMQDDPAWDEIEVGAGYLDWLAKEAMPNLQGDVKQYLKAAIADWRKLTEQECLEQEKLADAQDAEAKLEEIRRTARLSDADAEAEITRLSTLPPLAYAKQKKSSADHIGISLSALDKLVKAEQQKDKTDTGQGRKIELHEPEPWSQPVDGAVLLDEITDQIKRHMVMAPGAAEVAAIWVLHTHALEAFNISPRLGITSPCLGCGKTTLQDILGGLVPRALLATNITSAAVFRTVEVARPTLLCDEADTWLRDNEELRGILNTGHRRGGYVIRVVGDDNEPRRFSTFCAATISMIGRLPATLASRGFPISLQRKLPGEKIEEFSDATAKALEPLASKAARWAADYLAQLRALKPQMPAALTNRNADNWRVLITIADIAGGNWPAEARRIAMVMAGPGAPEIGAEKLLADIRTVFVESGLDIFPSADLVAGLAAIEGSPWAEHRGGKPITTNALARLLKPYGICPENIGTRRLKGYRLEAFTDAFGRYLTP